jgi:hypothetical protein
VFLSYEIAQAYEQIFRICEEFSQQPYRRKLAPEVCDDAMGAPNSAMNNPLKWRRLLTRPISHFGYVLETGRIILQHNSAALCQNPQVKNAYLGG